MAFKRFVRAHRSYERAISVWSRGQASISAGAVKGYGLDQFKAVVLFYDDENFLVGLKFTTDVNEEGAIPYKTTKNGIVLGLKAFLDFHNITYSDMTRKYSLAKDNENGLIVFDTRRPTEEIAPIKRTRKVTGDEA